MIYHKGLSYQKAAVWTKVKRAQRRASCVTNTMVSCTDICKEYTMISTIRLILFISFYSTTCFNMSHCSSVSSNHEWRHIIRSPRIAALLDRHFRSASDCQSDRVEAGRFNHSIGHIVLRPAPTPSGRVGSVLLASYSDTTVVDCSRVAPSCAVSLYRLALKFVGVGVLSAAGSASGVLWTDFIWFRFNWVNIYGRQPIGWLWLCAIHKNTDRWKKLRDLQIKLFSAWTWKADVSGAANAGLQEDSVLQKVYFV